jgi:hypothetical protein
MRKLSIVRRQSPERSQPAQPQSSSSGGFKAALAALVERKMRELKGKWRNTPERERRKEATSRAVHEMAKRIAKETGRKELAASTIRRYAARDATPKGIDPDRVQRQTRIDQAGGLAAFADRTQQSVGRIRRWRERGGPAGGGGSMIMTPRVDGALVRGSERYKKVGIQYEIILDEIVADQFRIAQAVGDEQAMKDIIGEALAYQWFPADSSFDVTVIHGLDISDRD